MELVYIPSPGLVTDEVRNGTRRDLSLLQVCSRRGAVRVRVDRLEVSI